MEFLDTNIWSLIIFMVNALLLISVTMIFSKTSISMIILTISLWISSQIIFIVYGYYTNQLGFVLLGVFNIIVSAIGAVVSYGQEDDLDDDN